MNTASSTNDSKVDDVAKGSTKGLLLDPPPVFSITPERVVMEPGSACTFTVRGLSAQAGVVEEFFHCMAAVGNAKSAPIFQTSVNCKFLEPLIEPSDRDVTFDYICVDNVQGCALIPLQSQTVELRNISPLPLTLSLRASPPFAVDAADVALPAGECAPVVVTFDPAYPGDAVSRRFDAKLSVAYREHPQRDSIKLSAETHFPNLTMDISEGSFGCVLNDTPSNLTLTLVNPSAVTAHYSWSFTYDGTEAVDPSACFDILPIRGDLAPGSSEPVELFFKGLINAKAKATALCEVRGGPTYELPLTAESSAVAYRIDRTLLDFGLQLYDRVEEKEVVLTNVGRVALSFSVHKTMLSRPNVIEVLPPRGTVIAGDKQKLIVRLLPGLPTKLREIFFLQVAHFEPEQFVVTVEGIYPRIILNLPREQTDGHKWFHMQAAASFDSEKAELEAVGLGDFGPHEPARSTSAASELTTEELLTALGRVQPALLSLFASWGKVSVSSDMLSRDEFRISSLTALGAVCTAASANVCFAALAAAAAPADIDGGAGGAVAADPGGPARPSLPLAFLFSAIQGTPQGTPCAQPRPPPTSYSVPLSSATLSAPATAVLPPAGSMSKSPPLSGECGLESVMTNLPSKAGGGVGRASAASDATGRYRVFSDTEVDAEAERLALCSFAAHCLDSHCVTDAPPPTAVTVQSPMIVSPAARTGTALTTGRIKYLPLLEPLPPPPPNFTIAKYVLDFGNVVKGASKKKVFRLKNAGWHAISLDIDKNSLLANGFRTDPDKVVKLPGLPEQETTEFTVTFSSKPSKVALGFLTQELRLDLKPGPPVVVLMRANVTVPEVKLSEDQVYYGPVVVGQCRTSTIILHNPKEVVAEWSVKPPIEQSRDFGFFACSPSSGTLAPNGRLLVKVTFTPRDEREYLVKLSFKVANNTKPSTLTVHGAGKELRLEAYPEKIELPPVLPHAQAASAHFELFNPTDYPIEVYSLDFDDQYLVEEALLREADYPVIGGQHDMPLLLLPRTPGEGMWPSVVEAVAKKKLEAEELVSAAASTPAITTESGEEAAAQAQVGEIDAPGEDGELPPSALRLLVLIAASPFSRSAELADLLSKTHDVPVVSLAEVVRSKGGHAVASDSAVVDAAPEDAPSADREQITREESTVGEQAVPLTPAPFDEESAKAAVAEAVSRDSLPLGGIILLPELPIQLCGSALLLKCLKESIGDEPLWAFSLSLQKEALEARAAREHAAALSRLPVIGPLPDLGEYEYDALDEAGRGHFEDARQHFRRAVAACAAAKDAAELSYRFRFRTLTSSAKIFEATKYRFASLFAPSEDTVAGFAITAQREEVAATEAAAASQVAEAGVRPPVDKPDTAPTRLPGAFDIDASSDDPTELGGRLLAYLPQTAPALPVVSSELSVPSPCTMQIVRRPRSRPARQVLRGFELRTMPAKSSPEILSLDLEEGTPAICRGGEEFARPADPEAKTRWVVPPRSTVPLQLNYTANSTGRILQSLRFEIVGGGGADKSASVTCAALCAQPSISKDYRNVFGRKVKTRDPLRVHRTFVVARSTFEFGALLVGRPQPELSDQDQPADAGTATFLPPHPEHTEMLHMSNNGPFPLTVRFSFLNDGAGVHSPQPRPFSPTPAPTMPEEGGVAQELAMRPAVFFVDCFDMVLRPEETRDLRLSAFPDVDGLFEEQLVCTVSENPQPVLFPLSAVGSTPAVALDTSAIVFERMLLRRSDAKIVRISSRSAMPLRWAVKGDDIQVIAGKASDGEDKGPGEEEFTIAPLNGVLNPGETCDVAVTFHARDAALCTTVFNVEVSDVAEPSVLGIVDTLEVSLEAEAYDVDVRTKWPDESYDGLNFGSFKVVDEQAAALELINAGKYEVGFKFYLRKSPTKEVLTLTPAEGILPSADGGVPSKLRIDALFKTEVEVALTDNTDVRLQITELLTGEILQELTVPVRITARALFSRYHVVPRGINFGPLVYGTQKERSFELTNTGEFDFAFTLRHAGAAKLLADDESSATIVPSKLGRVDAALTLGNFTVTPPIGSVEVGGVATIIVKFEAGSDAQRFLEDLVIDVADRDVSPLNGEPCGKIYELIAESCIPGIETLDFTNIFEEQAAPALNRTETAAATPRSDPTRPPEHLCQLSGPIPALRGMPHPRPSRFPRFSRTCWPPLSPHGRLPPPAKS